MREADTEQTESNGPQQGTDHRALRILAKSVYRELKASGYSRSDMVGFTNALLDLVTSDMKSEDDDESS